MPVRDEDVPPEPTVQPNIKAIADLIRQDGAVHKAEEKGQKARSDLGNIYQRVENDFHGNRKAVKLVRSLLTGTEDAASDFMRTFEPLAEHFNLFPEQRPDLVDAMEGGDDDDADVEKTAPPQMAGALDAARAHLSGGTKPEEPAPEADKPVAKKKGSEKAKLSIVSPPPVTH